MLNKPRDLFYSDPFTHTVVHELASFIIEFKYTTSEEYMKRWKENQKLAANQLAELQRMGQIDEFRNAELEDKIYDFEPFRKIKMQAEVELKKKQDDPKSV